ncbi:MAG: hypothetical protein R3B70_12815 [Polyangiaceae bacterium]
MAFLEQIRLTVVAYLHRLGINGEDAALGVVLFLVTTFGSIALTGSVLVRLPQDFLAEKPASVRSPLTARTLAIRALRHTAGVLLILIGLLLSVPGVPGQGLLTILAGLFVSDLPGTRRLLRRLLRGPRVLSAVNKLRARYKHPPLHPPEPPEHGKG